MMPEKVTPPDHVAKTSSLKQVWRNIMAPSKKKKTITAQVIPQNRRVVALEDPESIYREHPSWSFSAYDEKGQWAFNQARLNQRFWSDILPKLKNFETMTWRHILLEGKKGNHSIQIDQLSKAAQKRLKELQIDTDCLVSLRLGGVLRLYGFLSRSTFVILWFDDDHGDNDTCVCRSYLKHS